jgi:hypothetical protein
MPKNYGTVHIQYMSLQNGRETNKYENNTNSRYKYSRKGRVLDNICS